MTYGRVVGDGTRPTDQLVARAVAARGSTPWTASALRRPPWRTTCDGVEDPSYLICGIVQGIQKQTLEDPKPSFAMG